MHIVQCSYWRCKMRRPQNQMKHEAGGFYCNDDCFSNQLIHGKEEFQPIQRRPNSFTPRVIDLRHRMSHRHITYKPDWKLSILALNKELGIVSCVEKNVYILLGSKLTYVPNQRL